MFFLGFFCIRTLLSPRSFRRLVRGRGPSFSARRPSTGGRRCRGGHTGSPIHREARTRQRCRRLGDRSSCGDGEIQWAPLRHGAPSLWSVSTACHFLSADLCRRSSRRRGRRARPHSFSAEGSRCATVTLTWMNIRPDVSQGDTFNILCAVQVQAQVQKTHLHTPPARTRQ